jgi:hypothetical protein
MSEWVSECQKSHNNEPTSSRLAFAGQLPLRIGEVRIITPRRKNGGRVVLDRFLRTLPITRNFSAAKQQRRAAEVIRHSDTL